MTHVRRGSAVLVPAVVCLVLVCQASARSLPRPAAGAATAQAAGASGGAQDATLGSIVDVVAADVEQLRGWTFKRPVARERVPAGEARRKLAAEVERTLPPERRHLLEVFLATAGLVPAGTDLAASLLSVLEQQVAGYYDPGNETLYLVDRPGSMPAFVERMILAHELTHALDDQYVGLDPLAAPVTSRTADMDVVLTSLAEGSATSLMVQYMAREAAAGRVNMAEAGAYLAEEMTRAQALAKMPPYFSAMFGSYLIGSAFLARGDLTALLKLADNRTVGDNFLAAWKSPPRSSEQVLHPATYWDAATRDEPVVMDDAAVERWLAHEGRFVVHRDTLGELMTALLTEPREIPRDLAKFQSAAAWTNPGAIGWGGDRFYLLASGRDATAARRDLKDPAAVWLTAWDSGGERDEFLSALERGRVPPRSAAVKAGSRLAVVFIGFDQAERDALMAKLTAAPLPMTKDATAWDYRGSDRGPGIGVRRSKMVTR